VRKVPNETGEVLRQIGEVAAAVGLSLRTIRYYEEVGIVLPSGRSIGGFRLYTDADVERFGVVKAFKPLKLSLDEMRDLLGILDTLEAGTVLGRDERDRLKGYAEAAAVQAKKLREQLDAVNSLSVLLAARAADTERSERRRARTLTKRP
jgi:MerR family transcriptional regulator, copper efflux regulator